MLPKRFQAQSQKEQLLATSPQVGEHSPLAAGSHQLVSNLTCHVGFAAHNAHLSAAPKSLQ